VPRGHSFYDEHGDPADLDDISVPDGEYLMDWFEDPVEEEVEEEDAEMDTGA
jgi:hypothetical protein